MKFELEKILKKYSFSWGSDKQKHLLIRCKINIRHKERNRQTTW